MDENNEGLKLQEATNIGHLRIPYHGFESKFAETELPSKNPFKLFDLWFQDALQCPEIVEPNAMTLATCTKDGRPSARVVLLKGYSEDGFCFYTNYDSRKGKELIENPYAALVLFWQPLTHQVRIEGKVVKLPQQISEKYFHSRPRESQLSASASNQSKVISSREALDEKYATFKQQYSDAEKIVPKPDFWGGFRVIPEVIEFWQGQTTRLHDRIRFRRKKSIDEIDNVMTHEAENGWVYERLEP